MSKKKFTFQPIEADKEVVEAVNAVPEGYMVAADEVKEAVEDTSEKDLESTVDDTVVIKAHIQARAVVDGVKRSLNVRKNPEVVPNNQIGILDKGTEVIVVDPDKKIEKNGITWFKIEFGNPAQVGYAMEKYIRIL